MKLKRIERRIIHLIQIWDEVSLNQLCLYILQNRRVVAAALNRMVKAGMVIRTDVNRRQSRRSLHYNGFCYYRLTAKGQRA